MGKQCQTLFLGGSKITADGDCSHEIKRHLLLERKVMTNLLLLLLLSRISRVRLCWPTYMAAHQAPPSLRLSRQEHWVAISFSNAWKWKVKLKSLSHVWLLATPWTIPYQPPPSLGFSRQKYCSGLPLPSPVTNLDSILKSRDITLPTKVHLVKAMVFLVACMDVRVGL